MPGAVPRAPGEEVTVGVSLPQPRSRRAVTAQCSHGSQCDWTPVFFKAWIPGEKSWQGNTMLCCKPTACAIPAWPHSLHPLCKLMPTLEVSPPTQQRWSHRVSASSTAACAALGQTDGTILLPGTAASCTVLVMEQLVLPGPGFCLM